MDKNTFCILPWIHTYVFSSGEVSACCEQQRSLGEFTGNLKDTMNIPDYKKLRKDLYEGVKSADCTGCWEKEEKNYNSMRTEFNRNFKKFVKKDIVDSLTNFDDYSLNENFKLRYLDVRSSNLCNYKCKFCGLQLSSGWYQYYKNDEKNDMVDQLKKYDNFNRKTGVIEFDISLLDLKKHIPYIEAVNLAGGEPVMMSGTYLLLEEFIKQNKKDTEWNIISNTSKLSYGKKNIIDLLSFFDKWKWSMSIDATGDAHKYLRSGVDDWNTVYENSLKLLEYEKNNKGMKLSIHSSVSWQSLYRYYDVWELYKHTNVKNITMNPVQWPEHMAINILPMPDLEKAWTFYTKKYNENKQHRLGQSLKDLADYISGCIKNHTYDSNLLRTAIQTQYRHDRQRNQSLFSTFPEWKHLRRLV